MQTKLFVGFRLTPELKGELEETSLLQIPYEGKEYVGRYLESAEPTLAEILTLSSSIQEVLPRPVRETFVVFPQFFLG